MQKLKHFGLVLIVILHVLSIRDFDTEETL